MGNTGFGVHSGEVADGHTRGFTSGPGRRGNCDQWFEVSRHRQALANGWVHVIQEIGRVSRIQVGCLGGVHGGTASNRDKAIEFSRAGKRNRFLKRLVARFHSNPIKYRKGDLVIG